MEWWNILCWKGPTQNIESNSWIHKEPPKIQTILFKCYLSSVSLGLWPLPWGRYFSAGHLVLENLFLIPHMTFHDTSPCWSLNPCLVLVLFGFSNIHLFSSDQIKSLMLSERMEQLLSCALISAQKDCKAPCRWCFAVMKSEKGNSDWERRLFAKKHG